MSQLTQDLSGETLSENKLVEVNYFTLQHVINLYNQFLDLKYVLIKEKVAIL